MNNPNKISQYHRFSVEQTQKRAGLNIVGLFQVYLESIKCILFQNEVFNDGLYHGYDGL